MDANVIRQIIFSVFWCSLSLICFGVPVAIIAYLVWAWGTHREAIRCPICGKYSINEEGRDYIIVRCDSCSTLFREGQEYYYEREAFGFLKQSVRWTSKKNVEHGWFGIIRG